MTPDRPVTVEEIDDLYSMVAVSETAADGLRDLALRLLADLNKWKAAEKEVSDAYLRVRSLLNAYDTQPGGVDRFEVTENAIKSLLQRAEKAERERDAEIERCEALIAAYREAIKQAASHPSLDEALNSGDGTYRP